MITNFTLLPSEEFFLQPDENDVKTLTSTDLPPAEQIEYLIRERSLLKQELQRTQQQLQDTHEQHLQAREDDHKRISQDLHDELGQYLVALKIDLDLVIRAQQLTTGKATTQPELQSMSRTLDACLEAVSRVVARIRIPKLQADCLLPEIEKLFAPLQKCGIIVSSNMEVDSFCLSACTASEVYHLFQEAITNIIKHAQATQVHFSVQQAASKEYLFKLTDNGKGIQAAKEDTCFHFGLSGMQERAQRIQASLQVQHNCPLGTVIELLVPSNNIA